MISRRQYYETPSTGQAKTSAYSGIRRFDPDYGLDYGHYKYGVEHQTDYRYPATWAVPGTGTTGARQSLSALDEKRANEIRRGVYAHVFLDVKNSHKSDASCIRLISRHPAS
ncbi:hypothetical protein LZ32DRAFT_612380 [Colletotrichum eremochloae]|nr:hypothetical protein LZ32DRAFT_612380 [Colletotrichum eremochloae]